MRWTHDSGATMTYYPRDEGHPDDDKAPESPPPDEDKEPEK